MQRNEQPTGRIKIRKTPTGEAPLEVRMAWEGLILPCFPHIGHPSGDVCHVVTGEKVEGELRGVIVPQDLAIAELLKFDLRCREAACWWLAQGLGKPGMYFFFPEDEIDIVGGVSEVPWRVFDDMDTGHWEEMPLGAVGR